VTEIGWDDLVTVYKKGDESYRRGYCPGLTTYRRSISLKKPNGNLFVGASWNSWNDRRNSNRIARCAFSTITGVQYQIPMI
jgi:hypothetical protein